MKDIIRTLTEPLEPELIEHRRHLHMHPEASFHEKETQKYITAHLDRLKIPYQTWEGHHSTVARIKGGKPGPVIAFRADIDALPIQDAKDVPYRSQNPGCMHACGHDGHTAALLCLAKLLAEHPELVAGEVVLIFQHAEELIPGGAKVLVEAGVLEGVDMIFGAHIWAGLETGTVDILSGPLMASSDKFAITLSGGGGHAAQPHSTSDPIVAAAALITQLQTVVSRNCSPLSPAVLSVCQVHAGASFNVIPDSVWLQGTIRSLDEAQRNLMRERLEQIVAGVCAAHSLTYELEFEIGYPVLVNHADVVDLLRDAVRRGTDYRIVETEPSMGGEDFASYLQQVPGVFFRVGRDNKDKGILAPLHTPYYDIDERAMLIMLQCFAAAYLRATDQM